MEATASLKDAALELIERGVPIVVCDGKVPLGGERWHERKVTAQSLPGLMRQASSPAIGVKLGPGSVVDIEADSEAEEALFTNLFDGCESPTTPTYKSRRGKHRLFRFDDRFVGLNRAVVNYSNGNGVKLGIRIGADGKAAQSVIPPSVDREWLVSWDDCEPANLPDEVVERIIAATRPPVGRTSAPVFLPTDVGERARKYLAKVPPAISGAGGHDQTFHAACVLVQGFALDRGPALALLSEWNQSCQPPWSDWELEHKIDDALNQPGERGNLLNAESQPRSGGPRKKGRAKSPDLNTCDSDAAGADTLPEIANYTIERVEDESGETKNEAVPRSIVDIRADVESVLGGWPRAVDGVLFIDDPQYGINTFERRGVSGFFGYLKSKAAVDWKAASKFVSQAELFAETERTARRYDAIELLPHEPPFPNFYYSGFEVKGGDGSRLHWLLDRFRPATTVDRDLIQAALMTAFWGGPFGCRPAFVVTADEGRGVGKTKLAEIIAEVAGGSLDISAGEDIGVIKQRFLSPEGQSKRVAILDNVKSLKFSWAEVESLITTPTISGKRMYVGEGQRPNAITWLLTLNGVSLATDMAQRSVVIKLARGANGGAWYEETLGYIHQHRNELVGDIIAALKGQQFPVAAHSRWAAWEKDVLCRLPDPGEAQRVIAERQGEANCEQDEAEIIEDHFADQLSRLGYDPTTAQVRIPVATVARWFSWATGEPTKTASASKRLKQMGDEGQVKRLRTEVGRSHGRCFIWTGERADIFNSRISNDLQTRLAEASKDT